MKRSEMVQKICELLEVQSLQGMVYMFKAEQIMQLLEKNKMMPPEIIKEETDGEEHYQQIIVNEWEPEDETK